MIVLTVLSYNGTAASDPACTFDELGGTVGRADSNQLVLPDPERTVSRVHARVVCLAGRYSVVDNGSNTISVNGVIIGTGKPYPLTPGDRVQIGGYVLGVSAAAAALSSDPFADLFGDAALGLAAPARAAVPHTAHLVAQAGGSPMAAPFPAPFPVPIPAPVPAPSRPLAPGFIPDDWDPFSKPSAAAAKAQLAAHQADQSPLLDLPPAPADSLDALFGLGKLAPASDPFAAAAIDPLGSGAGQALQLQPNTAAHADPLMSFVQPAVPGPASVPDHASELHTPMPLPRPLPPPQAGSAAAASAAPQPTALPAGAVFSWDNPPAEGRVVTLPGVHAVARGTAPAAAPAITASNQPPASAAVTGNDELLQALLRGLDAPGLRLQQLDTATMQLLGQLLRESLRGTVELLVARTALKRELRAQMTMIVPTENNPLKFSPTVEVALQHLLGPPTKGFMPPAQAVRDACDDLRAHQLGVMAGMRAALEGVLQRFDPQLLEAKITRKSAVSNLIPTARKARLWELFQELFGQLQSEAQDDFDELFGKAFLRAYEDQLDRLQGEPGPN